MEERPNQVTRSNTGYIIRILIYNTLIKHFPQTYHLKNNRITT